MFKHMPAKYVEHALTKGQLRISRISTFHTLPEPIGDRCDGGVQHSPVMGIADISENGIEPRFHADYWALCLSMRRDSSLCRVYDGVVRVLSADELLRAIQRALPEDLGEGAGKPVIYDDHAFAIAEASGRPHPFIKRKQYEGECEYRLIWRARTDRPDALVTQSPEIAALLTAV